MNPAPTLRRRLLVLTLLLTPLACGDSDDGGTGLGPDPDPEPEPESSRAVDLTIKPSFVKLNVIGDTAGLTAMVLD